MPQIVSPNEVMNYAERTQSSQAHCRANKAIGTCGIGNRP
jgi:hypothetical protein